MTERKPASSQIRVLIPVITAIAVATITAAGATMYRHETSLLKLGRHLEKLQIKDYRQQRDNLRQQVRFFGDNAAVLEAVLEQNPDAFGPNGRLVLKQRREDLEEARERLENYVEENKHYGSSD